MPTTLVHATVLRNISGSTRYFAYLGLNGAELEDDQDIAVNGDIWSLIARSQIKTDALRYDLENGIIVIMQSPGVFVYDATADKVAQLQAAAGAATITYTLPSGSSYVGPDPDVD